MDARARSGRWELPRTTLAAREARTHVDGYRETLGEEPWRRARLLVSELATNAVRHGGGRIELVVEIRAAGIRFSVSDEGAGRAVPRPPGDDGGFGLHLVEDLADRWGQQAAGSAVWFDVDANAGGMSRPDLVVEVRRATERVTVALRGELDGHGEPEAHAALQDAVTGGEHVVLDLSGLEFIDSSGLRLVLVWNRRLEESATAFSIVRGPAHVQRPFASAGLEGLLPFVDGPPA